MVNKIKILCLALAGVTCFLSCGANGNFSESEMLESENYSKEQTTEENISEENQSENFELESEFYESNEETVESEESQVFESQSESESQSEKTEQSDIEELSDLEKFLAVVEKVDNAESFYTVSKGATKSAGVTQKISARRVVFNGGIFKESISCSLFVKTATQVYVYGGKFLLRGNESVSSVSQVKWSNTATDIGEKEYLSRYGSVTTGFSNFIVNEQTVVSVTLTKANENYVFEVELDKETAGEYMAKEMKTNAGSSELPTFSKINMVVTADSDFDLISVRYLNKYKVKVKVLGKVDCCEDMTETFYGIGEENPFPEEEFFEKYL